MMATRVVLYDPVIEAAAQAHVIAVARQIAQSTRRRAKDHDYRNSLFVTDIRNGHGARVGSNYSFAHLDEFGSVNNPPTAAMRSSAAEQGRYVPGGRR